MLAAVLILAAGPLAGYATTRLAINHGAPFGVLALTAAVVPVLPTLAALTVYQL